MRNEEFGINAFAPLGQVMLWVLMPRAEPTADGFCPFRVLVGAGRGDCEYVLL